VPVVNAAAEVAFLVGGEEKAEIVEQVFEVLRFRRYK